MSSIEYGDQTVTSDPASPEVAAAIRRIDTALSRGRRPNRADGVLMQRWLVTQEAEHLTKESH